jgi:hypothetical protein
LSAPAVGVYTYATDGYEAISVFGGRHDYPARTYSTVRRSGGCAWEAEHKIIEEHVDRHARCSDARGVANLADGRDVEFFHKKDGLVIVCPPGTIQWSPADVPGTSRRATCASEKGPDDEIIVHTVTFRGRETMVIGGVEVATAHFHQASDMHGRAEGTSSVDFWLHPDTGLIVQEYRSTDTEAHAAFGNVHYEEHVRLRLESLTPSR